MHGEGEGGMRLNHVTLSVTDVDRSAAFYKRLGLEQIVANHPHYARFVCPDGDETLSLHSIGENGTLPAASTTIHFECDDLDDRVAELKAKGISFEQDPTDQPYLWREAILADPDGNVIFLFHAGPNRLDPPWRLGRGAPGPSELRGERVVLRPLRNTDRDDVVRIGAEPSVSRWWPDMNADTFASRVEGRAGTRAFAIEHASRVIGMAEYWEEKDPEYRHAGIDLFLTTDLQGQGLGADTVRTLARHLFRDRGHHRITIDPDADNTRAIRCYERVGFEPVGIMRRYSRAADGSWQDGLLLDLLADEIEETDTARTARGDG